MLRVAVEKFTHLAQHALGMHAHQFTLQRFPLLCRAEPWQLQQPCGRDVAQQWGDGIVPAAELGQRLQHCVVWLAGAEALHAIATRARDVVESSDEMLDQRGLSDPGFASHPSQRAATCVGAFPSTLQDRDLGRAANKCGRCRNSERLGSQGNGARLRLRPVAVDCATGRATNRYPLRGTFR